MDNVLYLSKQQWNNRIKSIETKNLRKYHRTPNWITISHNLSPCIIEIQLSNDDNSIFVIDAAKYKALRVLCMTESFALGKTYITK